jgi:hypothetical protein
MLPDQLWTYREAFLAHHPDGDFLRVAAAFDDVAALAELHSTYQEQGRILPVSYHEAAAWFAAGRNADALHRALIEAACRAVAVLVHEAFGQLSKEVSATKLVEMPVAAAFTRQKSWAQLYCLTVYRNKIVTHHEIPRMGGGTTAPDGTRRLVPLPQPFAMSHAMGVALTELRDHTGIAEGEENYFELLEKLFYRVPVTFGASQSAERKRIDALAERGGVPSLSVADITECLGLVLADVPVLLDSASDRSGRHAASPRGDETQNDRRSTRPDLCPDS